MKARRNQPHGAVAIALGLMIGATLSVDRAGSEPMPGGWVREFISTDPAGENHRFDFDRHDGSIEITAGPEDGTGSRMALIRGDAPLSVDQESCVTWYGPVEGTIIQPGVVLRVDPSPDRTRMVMVTNNIAYEWRRSINVHIIDSALGDPSYQKVGTNSTTTIGYWNHTEPLPWRFCARAIGRWVEGKAWSLQNGEPSWSDPTATVRVLLQPEQVHAGRPGVYIGHLGSGQSTRLDDHETRVLRRERPVATVQRSIAMVRSRFAQLGAAAAPPNPGGAEGW